MQSSLFPGTNVEAELTMLATIIAAIAYGLVFSLYAISFHALIKNRKKYSKKKTNFLLAYITLMFLISTANLLSSVFFIIKVVFLVDLFHGQVDISTPYWIYPFSVWGADAFMVRTNHKLSALWSSSHFLCILFICCSYGAAQSCIRVPRSSWGCLYFVHLV